MNELETAVKKFCACFGRCGEDGFENKGISYCNNTKVNFPPELPSSQELLFFYTHIRFDDKPVIGGSLFLELKEVEQLVNVQDGWRWISGKGGTISENANWNPMWIVIGLRHGDAIIADTSKAGTPIFGSIQQRSFLMANSLALFLDVLSEWMISEEHEFNMEGDDEDSNPTPEFLNRMIKLAEEKLNKEEVEGFMKFFFG